MKITGHLVMVVLIKSRAILEEFDI